MASGKARVVQPEHVVRSATDTRRVVTQLEDLVLVSAQDDQFGQRSPSGFSRI
jgi:hypothetical protein